MRARWRAWPGSLLALCLLACGKREPAPAAGETTPVAAIPAPSTSATAVRLTNTAACRVMSLRGKVMTATGELIERGSLLSGDRWLVLEPDASFALKHTQSGRELTFDGPGRVLPCFGGEEEMIVGSGVVRTQAGVGVRPGASVVIGTPFGSVRYADAQARFVVTNQLEVREASGDIALVPTLSPARPLALSVGARVSEAVSADAALAACADAARTARDQASALLSAAPGGRGELAAAHVRARTAARLTCAAATASALAPGDAGAPEIAVRLKRLNELRGEWMAVPR
jgi:hypothetical protein